MAYDHIHHWPNDDRFHTVSPFRALLDLADRFKCYFCLSTLTCDAGEPTMTLTSLVSIDYYNGAIDF